MESGYRSSEDASGWVCAACGKPMAYNNDECTCGSTHRIYRWQAQEYTVRKRDKPFLRYPRKSQEP